MTFKEAKQRFAATPNFRRRRRSRLTRRGNSTMRSRPTGFYLDDVILGPAKQPTEGKVFGNVIEKCLEAFFSACCEDVKYAESQEYFADFADNNELEFYENDICIRHR